MMSICLRNPVKNELTAADIAQAFVEHVWKLHGMPLVLTTDRGMEFTNKFAATLCKLVGQLVHTKGHQHKCLNLTFLPHNKQLCAS